MSKSFAAYKLLSGQDDSTIATIWWDGEHIRTSSESLTSQLKDDDTYIHGKVWGDGKAFFDVLPYRFSNGYVRCKKTTVDEQGVEV